LDYTGKVQFKFTIALHKNAAFRSELVVFPSILLRFKNYGGKIEIARYKTQKISMEFSANLGWNIEFNSHTSWEKLIVPFIFSPLRTQTAFTGMIEAVSSRFSANQLDLLLRLWLKRPKRQSVQIMSTRGSLGSLYIIMLIRLIEGD
jgi:hypothetical protein